jgi:formylglycine-generating enzyme required for sulfatase activity/biopolymer transport protein ExbD
MKKKLPIVITILLLISFFAEAQDFKELKVTGKAKKLDTEKVARRDQNGNYCSAIQVISDMDGFSYDSNDGMVGDILDQPGKDVVYLTATERVLEIHKSGYKPLKLILSEYGISLQPQQMWEITIAGQESAATLPVTMKFKPTDAIIFIDGKQVNGSTHSLAPGQHIVRIEKQGYQTKEETISVDEKNVFFEWQLSVQPDAGLQIETIPDGATVYLDGIKLGVTPVAAFYPPGNYVVKIEKEGYVTLEGQTLAVSLPQTKKSYTLEENVGYITVNTHASAKVYFNDQLIANPKNVKLAPQLVKIKVTQSKADPLEQQVVLKRNDKLSFDLYPEVKTGTLQVAVTPFDAKIELTGDAGESYTATGMKIFENIPVGNYTIKVSFAGYNASSETVQIKQNEKINKSIALTKTASGLTGSSGSTTGSISNDYGIEMVFVKGGTFSMGCTSEQNDCGAEEKPILQVTVSDFYIGKYEVTQKQWKEIMGTNPSSFKNCDYCPVESVSWNNVQDFIIKLNQKTGKNYRLPTEAEWEYAARGGSAGAPTRYAGSNKIDEVGWYGSNSSGKTHPSGKKKSNELGIYDMSGNVWEWCSDWYGGYYYKSSSQINPKGPTSGSYRVVRGGSYGDGARNSRVSNRGNTFPTGGGNYQGFRLVLSP